MHKTDRQLPTLLSFPANLKIPVRLILACLILGAHCARPLAPTGGPVDKEPPTIVAVRPENNTTLVPRTQQVEFEFSESMKRKSLEKALFITPDPGLRLKTKWKGRRLRVMLGDSLDADRTYIITLGTDLKDSHDNSLAQSYTLAFSTGADISSGKISGTIHQAAKTRGVLIWCYILDGDGAPNPELDEANYITQAAQNGAYELSHLSRGCYRVFAVEDKDNNRFYTPGDDALGVPQSDICLPADSSAIADVNFRMSVRDTLGPAINSVNADDNVHVMIKFDEIIEPEQAALPANYKIKLVDQPGNELKTLLAYRDPADSTVVRLVTLPQSPGSEYELSVDNLRDMHGNTLDQDYSKDIFSASALPDTLPPEVARIVPADSARAVPFDSNVSIWFNEPVDKDSLQRAFSMKDDSGLVVNGRFIWTTPASVRFEPEDALSSLTRYLLSINLSLLPDLFGNFGKGQQQQIFTAIDVDTLSSISGRVSDPDTLATGRIFLSALQKSKGGFRYQVTLDQPGAYYFGSILPGEYNIEAFRDTDADGMYSYGSAFPFVAAERYVIYDDSIKVRARWPNEDNDFHFPVLVK